MSLDFTKNKSTLVQVLAWCRQATSHYLSQCWPKFLSPYGVTRPRWVSRCIFDAPLRIHKTPVVSWYEKHWCLFSQYPDIPWADLCYDCTVYWSYMVQNLRTLFQGDYILGVYFALRQHDFCNTELKATVKSAWLMSMAKCLLSARTSASPRRGLSQVYCNAMDKRGIFCCQSQIGPRIDADYIFHAKAARRLDI